jgi:subtilase family serine protease
LIDDVRLDSVYYNLEAFKGDAINTTTLCRSVDFEAEYHIIRQFYSGPYTPNVINIYLSNDSILDNSDSLLHTKTTTPQNDSWRDISESLTLPQLNVGKYYLLHQVDATNNIIEQNEFDNVNHVLLTIDTVYALPYEADFESAYVEQWKIINNSRGYINSIWEKGLGRKHRIENAHSGVNSWHTSEHQTYGIPGGGLNYGSQYVESPTFDLTSTTGPDIFNFWHHGSTNGSGWASIEYSVDCGTNWEDLSIFPNEREDDWDFTNFPLTSLFPSVQSSNNVRFRFRMYQGKNSSTWDVGFDDVYVGPAKSDLSIERDLKNFHTSSNNSNDTLHYYLFNSGLNAAPNSNTEFYWSTDSIFDSSDVLLGSKSEGTVAAESRNWKDFYYTKLNTSAKYYYIFYKLDAGGQINEMRESNNLGYFKINQENSETLPYFNDFESQINGWVHGASLNTDQWQWTTPKGINLTTTFSGTKCWITNDAGTVASYARMHLYTPVFDFSNTVNPVVSFNMILDQYHSHTNMSYSIDGGASWQVLDNTNENYNRWYLPMRSSNGWDSNNANKNSTQLLFNDSEYCFANYYSYNSKDVKRNTLYINDLGFLAGEPNVRFRFNLATNDYSNPNYTGEGLLLDDFEIREKEIDLTVDYYKTLMLGSNSKNIKVQASIYNAGNFTADSSVTKFYLSADTILNQTDHLLHTNVSYNHKPDFYSYINFKGAAPSNLTQYNYLLIEVDANQSHLESNELNNIIPWDLGIDSLISFPYVNNFNQETIDGWSEYAVNGYNNNPSRLRMRHKLAPTEGPYLTPNRDNGFWFSDLQTNNFGTPPILYLESPSFDFTLAQAIELNFDLSMTGANGNSKRDGGNLEYTIDGGNTWNVLNDLAGTATNWYGSNALTRFNGELGWHELDLVKAQRRIGISQLSGNIVQFRFKYSSVHNTYGTSLRSGFVLDNFRINARTLDYDAVSQGDTIYGDLNYPFLSSHYHILNNGSYSSPFNYTTDLYWSHDTILDASDSLIVSLTGPSIPTGNVFSRLFGILHPQPLDTVPLYLFYHIDAQNIHSELDETNNIGYYRVIYPKYPNLEVKQLIDTIKISSFNQLNTLTYQAKNIGLDSINKSETAFYISTDTLFHSSDWFIGVDTIRPLQIGDSVQSQEVFQMPTSYANGHFYLFYRLDDLDFENEMNEDDNTAYSVLEVDIKSDIVALDQGDTLEILPNVLTLPLTYTIRNDGQRKSVGSFLTRFYLSTDSIIDNSDLVIANISENEIDSATSRSNIINISLTTPIDSNKNYILYNTDALQQDVELNENNNTGSYYLNFSDYANLLTYNLKDTIRYINSVTTRPMSYTVYNNGNTTAKSTYTGIYWSTDSVLDTQDILLFYDTIPSIQVANSVASSLNVALPVTATLGYSYLIYQLDDGDSLIEWHEDDNLAFKVIFKNYTIGINQLENQSIYIAVVGNTLEIYSPNHDLGNAVITLRNSLGQLIQQFGANLIKGKNSLGLQHLNSKGIYFVGVEMERNVETIKFYHNGK